ncbi:MAG: transcriptional repressor LexA [Bacteroidetes bacterium]|nr:transcriptional repressor LexA [Bacteroidota bacterium]
MARGLTKRQGEALEFIRRFMKDHSKPPTFRELGEQMGIKSTRAVSDLLKALEKKGYIEREAGRSRGINLPKAELTNPDIPPSVRTIPVVSRIESREIIFSNIIDVLHFDSKLLPEGELFAVRVSDDAMNYMGLFKGDYVVCRRVPEPEQNSLVLGSAAGVLIVRLYEFANDKIHLKPSNKSYQVLSFSLDDRQFFVAGEVVLTFRKTK